MTEDAWRPIPEFPDYSVDVFGRVRHDSSGRELRVRYNQYGVPYVGLMKHRTVATGEDDLRRVGRQHIRSLPRLVAETFVPQTNAIFDTPLQIDGDRANCAASNLAWRPRWYVVKYNRQFREERYFNPIHKAIRDIADGQVFGDSLQAACANGLLESEVVMSVLNKTYTWPTYQQFELA